MGIDLPGNGSSETMHDKGDRNLIDWSMATNPLHAKKTRHTGVQRPNEGMDRETDGTPQFHRPCSAYYASNAK